MQCAVFPHDFRKCPENVLNISYFLHYYGCTYIVTAYTQPWRMHLHRGNFKVVTFSILLFVNTNLNLRIHLQPKPRVVVFYGLYHMFLGYQISSCMERCYGRCQIPKRHLTSTFTTKSYKRLQILVNCFCDFSSRPRRPRQYYGTPT